MAQKSGDTLYVAFWNIENLFDAENDSLKNDEDFTPTGSNQWTEERIEQKMKNLARVIGDMNEGRGPDVLGMAEVENYNILARFVNTHLGQHGYGIIHKDSPDERGIDCALLYKKSLFESAEPFTYGGIIDSANYTRYILRAELISKGNKINIFVVHNPSRGGGVEKSEPHRMEQARHARKAIDSILSKDASADIIVMGDFNDEPNNKSITESFRAESFECKQEAKISEGALLNVAYPTHSKGGGSYFFRKSWSMIDQVLLSQGMTDQKGYSYLCDSFEVFKREYMIQQEGDYAGAPWRTFGGKRYFPEGFSDHLPVVVRVVR